MKIQILSDLHIEFAWFDLPKTDADIIILAGDTGVGQRGINWAKSVAASVPVLYIHGNHEYYREAWPKLIETNREFCEGSNVHFLENNEFWFGDTRFLGCTLWTDFNLYGNVPFGELMAGQSMNDFKVIRKSPEYSKFRTSDALQIHLKSLHWLENELKKPASKTVVITHHAPSMKSIPDEFKNSPVNPAFASNLDDLILQYQPDLWIHGHQHKPANYFIGKTQVICNPRGYPDQYDNGFEPTMVVNV